MEMSGLGSVKKRLLKVVSSCKRPAVQVRGLCTCVPWEPLALDVAILVFDFPCERERVLCHCDLTGMCFPFLECFRNSCRLSCS